MIGIKLVEDVINNQICNSMCLNKLVRVALDDRSLRYKTGVTDT